MEAQFLIIKDEILNRNKEYNIVGLVYKLTINLEELYMTKLRSITDGSIDGVYSARFNRLIKNLPPSDVLDRISKNVVSVGNEIFKVPSFTSPNVEYLVDMSLSQCECPIGINGAPCKHQYSLWLKHWSTMSSSFLPIFNGEERQEFAKLAVGLSGPDCLYERIRDRITQYILQLTRAKQNLRMACGTKQSTIVFKKLKYWKLNLPVQKRVKPRNVKLRKP